MIQAGEQIAIVGAGVTGCSAARYVAQCGARPVLLDTRPAAPPAASAALADLPDSAELHWHVQRWPQLDVRLAIVSPGLPLDSCLLRGAKQAGVALYSDIDVFFAAVDDPVIGVTGTNGKSTVTALAGHLLNQLGVSTGVGGNLGDAALDIIRPEHQCYVLELSSFQLERSQQHEFYRSVILNISEDHLDHHGSLRAYIDAKQNIYHRALGCIVNREAEHCWPLTGRVRATYGRKPPPADDDWGIVTAAAQRWLCRGDEKLVNMTQLPLSGSHNEENMLAACALVYDLLSESSPAVGHQQKPLSAAQWTQALATFAGLPHRFEYVAERAGVRYINDSKATNLGATLAALSGLPLDNRVILVAGGDAKGVDLSPLQSVLPDRVKLLLVLGAAASHLAGIAEHAGVTWQHCHDIEQCVVLAAAAASPGDCVLLSPACSSLDMFSSFADRGNRFAAAARALPGGAA